MNKKTINLLFMVICMLIALFPFHITKVSAVEWRSNIIWIDEKDDIALINLNVYKSRQESYGFEFTSPKNPDDPKNFTSGNYYAQGMIRLTRSNELIFRTNGRWIGENQEKDGAMIRTAFSLNEWHNIKVEYNRSLQTITWYLDGAKLGTTNTVFNSFINAVSIFSESTINDGLIVRYTNLTTDEEKQKTPTDTYKYVYRNKQGVNNWYFCEFGEYNDRQMSFVDNQWKTTDGTGYIQRGLIQTGYATRIGTKYVAHKNGVVRFQGTVEMAYADCSKGNGVIAQIKVGDDVIWQETVTYPNKAAYDMTKTVKQGDEIRFVLDNNGNYSYDWTKWEPTVEYIDSYYQFYPDKYSYYEKNSITGNKVSLSYNRETRQFEGEGVIHNGYMLNMKEGYIFGKSYKPDRLGRHRISGKVINNSKSDAVVTVYKNNEKIRTLMLPGGETGYLDVRAYLSGSDTLHAEVLATAKSGEEIYFDVSGGRIPGTLQAKETSTAGFNGEVEEEFLLSSLIGDSQGENGMNFYFIHKDVKKEMIYNSAKSRWEVPSDVSNGYITKTSAFPGAYTDTLMEWDVPKDGTLKISGELFVSDEGDGTLCRIYKNDEVVWSNRVGGERLVRWDEPYDVSYFSNNADILIPVSENDKISFFFDQWRVASNDPVDFTEIKLSWVLGDMLSETTKWKLKNSTVFDIENKKVIQNGEASAVEVHEENGEIYISSKTSDEIFGTKISLQKDYISLKEAAGNKNIVRFENKLAIVYDGLPMMFGHSELGELNSMLNPTTDNEEPITYEITDENGNPVSDGILKNKIYYIKLKVPNYVGKNYDAKVLIAKYSNENVLCDVEELHAFEAIVGSEYISENEISFATDEDAEYIKLFIWESLENIIPKVQSGKYNVTE